MAKITIEFDDNILAKAIADVVSGMNVSGGSSSEEDAITAEDIVALVKEIGAKEAKPVLKNAGYSTPKALLADDEIEQEDLDEIYADLKALQEEDKEEDDDEDEEDEEDEEGELTVDDVKKAVQAFAKENGKEEADEILAEFDIKSVRSLNKLSDEDLEDLYAAVTEED